MKREPWSNFPVFISPANQNGKRSNSRVRSIHNFNRFFMKKRRRTQRTAPKLWLLSVAKEKNHKNSRYLNANPSRPSWQCQNSVKSCQTLSIAENMDGNHTTPIKFDPIHRWRFTNEPKASIEIYSSKFDQVLLTDWYDGPRWALSKWWNPVKPGSILIHSSWPMPLDY